MSVPEHDIVTFGRPEAPLKTAPSNGTQERFVLFVTSNFIYISSQKILGPLENGEGLGSDSYQCLSEPNLRREKQTNKQIQTNKKPLQVQGKSGL